MDIIEDRAQNDRVWVSKLNFDEDVRKQAFGAHLPERIRVRDSTIREGEETPGVYYTFEQKKEIVRVLHDIGIRDIDCGYVGVVEEQHELAAWIKDDGIGMNTHCHLSSKPSRYPEELEKIQAAGIDYVGFGLPINDWQIHLFSLPPVRSILRIVPGMIKAIQKKTGAKIILDLVDATRTDLELVKETVRTAMGAGIDLINIYDTVGALIPAIMRYFTGEIKTIAGSIPVGIHVHDDFGMATASSCAGVEAGAEYVDLVVNKLGDRAGNASLEETVASLELLYGVKTGIKLEKLTGLSKLVEKISGVKLPVNKPIVGYNTFIHESELHVMGAHEKESWKCFTPFKPEVVGQEEKVVFGPTTLHGDAVRSRARHLGYLDLSDQQVQAILVETRARIKKARFVTAGEMDAIIHRHGKSRGQRTDG
nr:hypothetical protein [Candidatus Sigynarchaeum springense]